MYRRYVDDTFVIFKSREHIPLFLNYLNSKHQNIEFTVEVENNGKLPFLDILITREPNMSFSTSIYRKPTYTGLMMKFSSFVPKDYKRNLVLTLTTRAVNICSNYFNMHNELKFLKETLFLNGFSKGFSDSYIGKQLSKCIQPPLKISSASRAVVYFPLTFTGNNSLKLRNKVNKLLKEFYPQILVRVIFKPRRTIQSFFKYKDIIPSEFQSSMVYQYKCNSCRALYVGQSKRQFKVRLLEHYGRSLRTNRPLGKPPFSAIREHSHAHDHLMESKSFSILACCRSDMDLPIVESLYIHKLKPSLNAHGTSVDLLCF